MTLKIGSPLLLSLGEHSLVTIWGLLSAYGFYGLLVKLASLALRISKAATAGQWRPFPAGSVQHLAGARPVAMTAPRGFKQVWRD